MREKKKNQLTNSRKRNYPEIKLQENLDSEIMEVLLQEARESFDEEIVVELTSNSSEEMESNMDRIEAWIKQWKTDHAD
jgi:adenylate kinase